ncbi:hypothetical protein CBR_g53743 [Chara braunii]|uniref:Lactate/malate dehydrogenase C-terminal domain-containing protein n=1 Tax=Chara braunii TaxID=69332 RepID=A0A388MBL0_CHABU|nr:hypothetical protein CBR_g53743 [Chara braunii]|eukprot:GBG91852.1 hypothetical protein CBR_g53743 [Chara braunii]
MGVFGLRLPASSRYRCYDGGGGGCDWCGDCRYGGRVPSEGKAGMERREVMGKNVTIYKEQAATAWDKYADKNVKVLVVANPAKRKAVILKEYAPSIPAKNVTCWTRLDHNWALAQIDAADADCAARGRLRRLRALALAQIARKPIGTEVINDDEWLNGAFIKTVQQRGAEIIKARKFSSALSAASAACCNDVDNWLKGTPEGTWVSLGVYSDGSYGVPAGLIYSSFPVTCKSADWEIVQGLSIDDFSRGKMDATAPELLDDKNLAADSIITGT